MKKCPACGMELKDTAKFCSACGANLVELENKNKTKFCSECGAKLEPGAKFCEACGAKVEEGTSNFSEASNPFSFNGDFGSSNPSKENSGGFDSLASQFENNAFEASELAGFKYEKTPRGTYVITGLNDKYASEICIPSCVEVIGEGAFANNHSLIKIELSEGLKRIEKSSFSNCLNLLKINIPKSVISIDDEAFCNCGRLIIEIPDSVVIVGKDVIKGTKSDKLIQEAKEAARKKEEARLAEEKRKEEEKRKAEEAAKLEREKYLKINKYGYTAIGFECLNNNKTDLDLLKKGETFNDGTCLNIIGNCYLDGTDGFKKDINKALEYYQKAIEAGCYISYGNIANIYRLGKLIPKDLDKFKKYAIEGVAKKDWWSASLLYYYYNNDVESSEENKKNKFDYLVKAIQFYENRYPFSPIKKGKNIQGKLYGYLGDCYQFGSGCKENRKLATETYEKGIKDFNDSYCMFRLGELKCKIMEEAATSILFEDKVYSDEELEARKIAVKEKFDEIYKLLNKALEGGKDVYGTQPCAAYVIANSLVNYYPVNNSPLRDMKNIMRLLNIAKDCNWDFYAKAAKDLIEKIKEKNVSNITDYKDAEASWQSIMTSMEKAFRKGKK